MRTAVINPTLFLFIFEVLLVRLLTKLNYVISFVNGSKLHVTSYRWRPSLLTPYMAKMMLAIDSQPDAVTLGVQVRREGLLFWRKRVGWLIPQREQWVELAISSVGGVGWLVTPRDLVVCCFAVY